MRGVRLLVLSIIWIGSFFLILDRVNISLAAPHIMDELQFDGTQMGLILSIYAWRMMFVFVGMMTLGMMALFAIVIRDHPHEHPWLAHDEKAQQQTAAAPSPIVVEEAALS